MEKVLSQIGGYYHAQVRFRLENLAKVVEPVLIVFIFAGVLLLALAVYLPIWRMNAAVRGKT
jgi:MSHA biogenesis protein MshG